ncbi:hypothetical protein LDENG_00200410 [Lucifuga dentata]|nr:hypothetical protein LDENG_00200410 [Lucifuga dentata]
MRRTSAHSSKKKYFSTGRIMVYLLYLMLQSGKQLRPLCVATLFLTLLGVKN